MTRYPRFPQSVLLSLLLAPMLAAQTVNVWLTTDDQKTLMQPQASISFAASATSADPLIVIDDSAKRQLIEGFGAAMTDSSAFLLNQAVPKSKLPDVMMSLFDHTQGIGISFIRDPMGASDLSRTIYSFDDQKAGATDPNLSQFSIDHDRADIIPLLQQARNINPQLKIMSNPWSPPGWMKSSGSMIGGSLNPASYSAFAQYFVRYIQAYESAGVPVDYISLQNEPLYTPTAYPGMSMSATQQLTVLRDYMLPALASANLSTKLLVYDHNWDQPGYPQTVLSDPAVASSGNVAGTAWHWYGGAPGAMTPIHQQHPRLNHYVTEASGGSWISDEVKTDFEMIVQSMRNWASAYVKWGLALDQNRGPFIAGGCGTCTPLVTVNNPSGAVSYPVDYYTLGHFSKFVLPGSRAVWSSNAPGLITAAFTVPNGNLALVVYNDSASARAFQVWWQGRSFRYTLPSLAGATFAWTGAPAARTMAHLEGAGEMRPFRPFAPAYTISAFSQLQASSYTDISNLQSEGSTDADGGFDIGYSADGSWLEFDNVDFGAGPSAVDVRWASNGSGGTLEFHLDSLAGPAIATSTFGVTGGWQTWQTLTAPVSNAKGVHRLFVVFHGAGSAGLFNLNWFKFH